MKRFPARTGYSLVEMLVVVAIIVLLLGLLLPAVQRVRAVAARISCSNNLKQVALAEQAHHGVRGYYTPGGTQTSGATSATITLDTPILRETEWSWAYLLLPYIEQKDLYSSTDSPHVRRTPVKSYYCSARRSTGIFNGLAKIDYAGNAGTDANGTNGVIARTGYGTINLAAITDGASNTILFGEKQLNRAALGRSVDDDESYCTPGWNGDWEVYRWGVASPAADRDSPCDMAPSHLFGSAHSNGVNIAFCDGAVRFVRYGIDAMIWQRLCIRNDGQVPDGNVW